MEWIITIFNIASVYYASKNNIATWIYGLIASILTVILFINDNMYMSFLFNVYSSFMCLFGIKNWKKCSEKNENELIVGCLSNQVIMFFIIINILFIINKNLGNNNPIFDSVGTASSIIGTYLLVKKDINCWYFWIIVDITYIVFGFNLQNYEYVLIYGTMLILAIYGLVHNNMIFYDKCRNHTVF